MTLLKTIIFTLIVPGTVTVLIPYWLLSSPSAPPPLQLGIFRYFGVLPILLGTSIYSWCAWDFTFAGKGTPLPMDPPKELVVRGLYRYVRNPMYVGVLSILLGEALFFESRTLFAYAAIAFLFYYFIVVLYEEPILKQKFGESYQKYRQDVPRWFPWRKKKNADPELNPDIMYANVEESKYKSELEIFDRWQSFSVELLRLSLLGIAIFGFLYQQVFANFNPANKPNVPIGLIKLLSQVSVALFAASTVCALLYRYGSTEAMLHYLRGLRNPLEKKSELEARNWWLSKCLVFKILSAFCLGLGAILAAVAIFKLL